MRNQNVATIRNNGVKNRFAARTDLSLGLGRVIMHKNVKSYCEECELHWTVHLD